MNNLDFYGTSYQFNTLGKSSYKTGVSFTSSIATTILVLVGVWLIGRDMIYKTNPKIIESNYLPDKTEETRVNNQNFTIAFRLEGYSSEPPSEEETYAFPHFHYEIFKKEDNMHLDKVFGKIYSPVPCSQIEARLSPEIQQLQPETLNCFDMAQIKADLLSEGKIEPDADINLYGEFQEDYVSAFYLVYANCKYKDGEIDSSTCVSYENAVERSRGYQSLALYVPRLIFDPENYSNPFTTYYQSVNYTMSPYTSVVYRMKYSLVTLKDDRGWIFEDIHRFRAIELETEDKEYRFLAKEAFDLDSAEMAAFDINFQRKQLVKTRIYMKIPELAANLGGLLKAVLLFFGFITKTYNTFRIETELIAKYINEKQEIGVSENSTANAISKKKDLKLEFSFWQYLKLKFKYSRKIKTQLSLLREIRQKLDVETLLKLLLNIQEKKEPTEQIAQFRLRDMENS